MVTVYTDGKQCIWYWPISAVPSTEGGGQGPVANLGPFFLRYAEKQ